MNFNNKIYTGMGDKGKTKMRDGNIVSKYNRYIEAYGSIDELMSFIGHLHDLIEYEDVKIDLVEIINNLMICCYIFSSKKNENQNVITEETIKNLEMKIDNIQNTLPELKNFIYPFGHPTISFCHIVRTYCRRVERNISKLKLKSVDRKLAFIYLNRLSDYFFVLARKLHFLYGINEKKWFRNF